MIENFLDWVVHIVEAMGYAGIFLMAALESTFMPIPSEATVIPAGYLVYQGKMSGPLVFALSVLGTMTGSLLNYAVARSCGRFVLVRYGKFFLMNESKLEKMEKFFERHGPISIFLGRLIFGVRHFISFPAGLAKMNLGRFSFYTAAGGAIWTMVLLVLGYCIGDHQDEIAQMMPEIKIGTLAVVGLIAFVYWRRSSRAVLA